MFRSKCALYQMYKLLNGTHLNFAMDAILNKCGTVFSSFLLSQLVFWFIILVLSLFVCFICF